MKRYAFGVDVGGTTIKMGLLIGFNKDYFCCLFKQCLGGSFTKYLNHVKKWIISIMT